ncbi:MAG: type VI secretion system-associated protein TagF [Paracoccaceae bacterium]
MAVAIGILGKHPDFGDFLHSGLSDESSSGLSIWLDKTLSELRDSQGEEWPRFWDAANLLRFWIGRAVLGRSLAGILVPSHDRVGRRYPLVLAVEGARLPMPTIDPNQAFWTALEEHLARQRSDATRGAVGLIDGLDLNLSADGVPEDNGDVLWAHRPDGDLEALLRAASREDPSRAATGRSYWWSPGNDTHAATWLGCNGLPKSDALGWILAGVAVTEGEPNAVR